MEQRANESTVISAVPFDCQHNITLLIKHHDMAEKADETEQHALGTDRGEVCLQRSPFWQSDAKLEKIKSESPEEYTARVAFIGFRCASMQTIKWTNPDAIPASFYWRKLDNDKTTEIYLLRLKNDSIHYRKFLT
eukprot:3215-Heterococcus_DN1.PRE.1